MWPGEAETSSWARMGGVFFLQESSSCRGSRQPLPFERIPFPQRGGQRGWEGIQGEPGACRGLGQGEPQGQGLAGSQVTAGYGGSQEAESYFHPPLRGAAQEAGWGTIGWVGLA